MTAWPCWACGRCRKLIGEIDPFETLTCVSLIYLGGITGIAFEGGYLDSVICAGCVTGVERKALKDAANGAPLKTAVVDGDGNPIAGLP